MDRNSENPPDYYYKLTSKQQRNWDRATRRMERNAELQEKHPPFSSTSNIIVTHIHYLTPITTIDELISQAQTTRRFVVDTECQKWKKEKQGGLIQIQFLHSPCQSTTILIEANYLPEPQSLSFIRIKELCSIIFNNNNEILSWGPIKNEFEHFAHLHLIHLGNAIENIDLQFLFRDWHNDHCVTHPEMERRESTIGRQSETYDTPDDNNYEQKGIYNLKNNCGHHTHHDPNGKWTLQDATAVTFNKFLDKSLTINHWQCGLDRNLNTWKRKLFSKHEYNQQTEQEQRQKLVEYAVNDCAAVAELYYYMNSLTTDNHRVPETPSTSATNVSSNAQYELSDISEDELIERLRPKFNKPQSQVQTAFYEETILETYPTVEEINEFNRNQNEHDPQIEPPVEKQTLSISKTERQRRKNMKLKWKQKHHPDFQHRIKRPIYHRYDYRKIRAQLVEDQIYTSHQITINRHKAEVVIGFKSAVEQERAKGRIKINYFSREQYYNRWG